MRTMPVAGTTKRIIAGRGERGISMPLVLLLFLICTVAASITITAATTASGRAAGLVEDDRLYYASVSAASVLAREVSGDDNKVTVTIRQTGQDSPSYAVYVGEGTTHQVGVANDFSLLEWATVAAMLGVDANTTTTTEVSNLIGTYFLFLEDIGYSYPSSITQKTLNDLTVSVTDAADNELSGIPAVTVDATASTDGSLELVVKASDSGQTSTQNLLFASAFSPGDLVVAGTGESGTVTQRIEVSWTQTVFGTEV